MSVHIRGLGSVITHVKYEQRVVILLPMSDG